MPGCVEYVSPHRRARTGARCELGTPQDKQQLHDFTAPIHVSRRPWNSSSSRRGGKRARGQEGKGVKGAMAVVVVEDVLNESLGIPAHAYSRFGPNDVRSAHGLWPVACGPFRSQTAKFSNPGAQAPRRSVPPSRASVRPMAQELPLHSCPCPDSCPQIPWRLEPGTWNLSGGLDPAHPCYGIAAAAFPDLVAGSGSDAGGLHIPRCVCVCMCARAF